MKKTGKKTRFQAKRKGKKASSRVRRFMAPLTKAEATPAAQPPPAVRDLATMPAAERAAVLQAIDAAQPRPLALPELWCKIETPVCVRFLEKMRADDAASLGDGRKRPAMLARVHDQSDGETKDLALPERLAAVFAALPQDGYVGRSYSIRRHRRHERKNAAGYTVSELQPGV